jgi:hypothetical protein
MLLQAGQDRSGRSDGELLADDLEDERPERIKPRQLVDPGPRPEVGMRVDDAGASTGSAFRRNARAVGSATAAVVMS